MEELDFGNGGSNSASANTTPNNSNGEHKDDHLSETGVRNTEDTSDITGKDNNKPDETKKTDDNASTGELSEGDAVEFEGVNYVVDANGNLVNDKGEIFKEAKDVKDWINSLDVDNDSNETSELSINSIQESLGISITDENGNNIEFTNDADGVKAYVNAVIELKSNELQQAAINKIYNDNPLLKQFNDYVQITGSPKGFGEIPDRSGIVLDKDNSEQLKAVIRMAAKEFGNKSLNENYIKYLQDSGSLYDEATQQLKALVDKDNQFKKEIEAKAKAQREADIAETKAYWDKVSNTINNRVIAGYKIPESITKEVNGQKLILTPKDFFAYLSVVNQSDKNGNTVTAYQRDLNNLSQEEYLNKELLDAWLMFTGGTYKDLIAMAVNEDKVKQLKLKAKEQRTTKTVKVIKKSSGKATIDDIVF